MTARSCMLLALTLTAELAAGAEATAPKARLPEGRNGIAAKYPGDKDLAKDPDVLFVETFDAPKLGTVLKRWDNTKNGKILSLSADVPEGSADRKSLLITHVGGKSTGAHLYRRLLPGHKQVFARFYVKFDRDCAPVHHFGTNLGGNNPPTRWPMVKAGHRPAGDKQFWTGVEPYGKSWSWDFYTYWQGMHVHGDGRYWGTTFLAGGSKPKVERGKWICVEVMVKVNDPVEKSNGEQGFWIDGKLWRRGGQVVSHFGPGFPKGRWTGGWWRPDGDSRKTFGGFQWRSVDALKVNCVWAYLYITKAPEGHVSRVWFDNIVVANKYIGPMEPAAAGR